MCRDCWNRSWVPHSYSTASIVGFIRIAERRKFSLLQPLSNLFQTQIPEAQWDMTRKLALFQSVDFLTLSVQLSNGRIAVVENKFFFLYG